jgi:hypothetical protein
LPSISSAIHAHVQSDGRVQRAELIVFRTVFDPKLELPMPI